MFTTLSLDATEPIATTVHSRARFTETLRAVHMPGVSSIPAADWDRLFPGASEDWAYYCGCERSGSEHFTFSAIAVYSGQELVAAAPVFRLDYRLDTTLGSAVQRFNDWVAGFIPWPVRLPVLGVGSPMSEECAIGIASYLGKSERSEVLAALVAGLEAHAKAEGVKLIAFKDVTDADATWASDTLVGAGFARLASLPVATLPLPFASFDEYLKSLPGKMRTDLRSKLKRASDIEVEFRDDIVGVEDEILALYKATRSNRKASYEAFDEVPDGYFREVMQSASGKSRVMLCRLDGRIVSFNFFTEAGGKVTGKLLGMDYSVARDCNLYFFNVLTIVRYCIEKGIGELQFGQTTYGIKLRLGCKLRRSWVYFKHRGAVLGPLFAWAGAKLSFDAVDPDLAKLGSKVVYLDPPTK